MLADLTRGRGAFSRKRVVITQQATALQRSGRIARTTPVVAIGGRGSFIRNVKISINRRFQESALSRYPQKYPHNIPVARNECTVDYRMPVRGTAQGAGEGGTRTKIAWSPGKYVRRRDEFPDGETRTISLRPRSCGNRHQPSAGPPIAVDSDDHPHFKCGWSKLLKDGDVLSGQLNDSPMFRRETTGTISLPSAPFVAIVFTYRELTFDLTII